MVSYRKASKLDYKNDSSFDWSLVSSLNRTDIEIIKSNGYIVFKSKNKKALDVLSNIIRNKFKVKPFISGTEDYSFKCNVNIDNYQHINFVELLKSKLIDRRAFIANICEIDSSNILKIKNVDKNNLNNYIDLMYSIGKNCGLYNNDLVEIKNIDHDIVPIKIESITKTVDDLYYIDDLEFITSGIICKF